MVHEIRHREEPLPESRAAWVTKAVHVEQRPSNGLLVVSNRPRTNVVVGLQSEQIAVFCVVGLSEVVVIDDQHGESGPQFTRLEAI